MRGRERGRGRAGTGTSASASSSTSAGAGAGAGASAGVGALVGARAGNPSLLARARTRAEPSARAPACAGGSVGARARARIGRVAHAGARIQGRSPVRHSHPVRKARGADERARAHVVSTDLFPRPKRIGVALRAREQLLRLKGHLRQIWHAQGRASFVFPTHPKSWQRALGAETSHPAPPAAASRCSTKRCHPPPPRSPPPHPPRERRPAGEERE